ncbi:MAG: DUF6391 domain-containing protein [Ardenticatenia bacterium]|nr:DUF6391 domain-containing protein [Ardenticatenia bacterium]
MGLLVLLLVLVPALAWLLVPGPPGASPLVAYTLPGHLWQVMRDKRRRSHQALVHATMNVIEERTGSPLRLNGVVEEDGFIVVGLSDTHLVLNAAREALARLQRGERRLALHLRCGFTLVVGQAIVWGAVLTTLVLMPRLAPAGILLGLGLATWLSRPASRIVQHLLIANADVERLRVTRAEVRRGAHPLALLLPGHRRVKVFVAQEPLAARSPGPTRRYRAY